MCGKRGSGQRIECIECEFEFPPRPAGAVFNNTVIKQINQSIEGIHDAMTELRDLPETKVVLEVAIPCSTIESPPWPELTAVQISRNRGARMKKIAAFLAVDMGFTS